MQALYHSYCPSDASVFQKKSNFLCQPLVFIHFCTIWDNCWVLESISVNISFKICKWYIIVVRESCGDLSNQLHLHFKCTTTNRHQYRMDITCWITNWKNWTTALRPQTSIDTNSPKFTAWQFGNVINCKSFGLTGRIN